MHAPGSETGAGTPAASELDALPFTTLLTSKSRVPPAPSSVAHCSVQFVVGMYSMAMPASQQPATGQGAQCVPLRKVPAAHETQPIVLLAGTCCPGGQSARQSVLEVAPGSDSRPGGHEVGLQVLRP